MIANDRATMFVHEQASLNTLEHMFHKQSADLDDVPLYGVERSYLHFLESINRLSISSYYEYLRKSPSQISDRNQSKKDGDRTIAGPFPSSLPKRLSSIPEYG